MHRADTDTPPTDSDWAKLLSSPTEASVLLVYEATFTYHHSLVQARFATTGLFATASGFLVAAHLSDKTTGVHWAAVPALALVLTLLMLFFDLRSHHLFNNVLRRGVLYERRLGFLDGTGFFSMMRGPQNDPVFSPKFLRPLASHSWIIDSFFVLMLLYWIAVLASHK